MDALDAIKVTYFQECEELLADLEQGLLALEAGEGDAETINAVFRAVHSIKGGAGAFGFEILVAFAHVFENALDHMRAGKLAAEPETVKTMLRASDILADHVQAAKTSGSVDAARSASMSEELEALISEKENRAEVVTPPGEAVADEWGFRPVQFDVASLAPASAWRLKVLPTMAMYKNGHDAAILLRELSRLADVQVSCDTSALPTAAEFDPEAAYLRWSVSIPAEASEAAIRDVFDFVGDDCPIELANTESVGAALPSVLSAVVDVPEVALVKAAPVAVEQNKAAPGEPPAATIRVDLERVDRLIDLVGELVINQAMLAQRVGQSELAQSSSVSIGLDELEQLTREIQDSVMAIRAQPVKSVFQRMPRLVREIASATGKRVRLTTEGEGTEVDKTVIERLSDPITHMLRNAIDHGLETPEERVAAGKPAEGVVRLAALHRSGRIVIEVSDDGKGINRKRVREIAVGKGLIAADANLTDDEIDNLIFLPGFSTAATVSNISGRGVGMDVVKRSIQALGGRITIVSQPGQGSTFTMSLPLTLAVLDGMVVAAGEHTLVAPLTAIVETLRPEPKDVCGLGPRSAVLAVRGAHVPLIDIGVALGWRSSPLDPTNGVVLLVESEIGGRAALVVDTIQGQRQVVIKSLEANYKRVDAVAAATILGDGRVALILDIDALIETQRRERASPELAKAS